MDAFYELAARDYRELVAAHDWATALHDQQHDGRVRLLDVACGSGKFPSALLAADIAADLDGLRIDVDLLDPSAFSIAEARGVLNPPFVPVDELEIGLEELDVGRGPYDVAWATHALYAVPPARLADGLARMHAVLRPGGLGVVAHATSASHYLAVYEAYRASHAPDATPYNTAEQVTEGLRAVGVDVTVTDLRYRTGTDDPAVAEGFLQRCLFDDEISLEDMTAPGPNGGELATYLAGCREGGTWTFTHHVHLMTWQAG